MTVGLTVIPQGIAYAIVAGLPPQYGLYSAFMGCFVYCVFGSSKDITIGPTAIMALMTGVHAQVTYSHFELNTWSTHGQQRRTLHPVEQFLKLLIVSSLSADPT